MSLYRGVNYEDPSLKIKKKIYKRNESSQKSLPTTEKKSSDPSKFSSLAKQDAPQALAKQDPPQAESVSVNPDDENPETSSEVKYEDEVDKLLDSLGPRYTDWPGEGPLPVDADLLPGLISGYKPPFRLLPYGVRATLTIREATSLRRLARILPPHFALGMQFFYVN